MAGTTKVLLVRRPLMSVIDANGITTGTEPADHIEVTLDRFGKGTQIQTFPFLFADHAGLQAEWEDGDETTILAAAIQAALPPLHWEYLSLSPAQRQYIDTAYTAPET